MRSDDDNRAVVDVMGLRRRVLAAGAVTLVLFLTVAYALAVVGAPDVFVLVAVVPIYLLVTRPLMRPVRDMTRLRRRLAYQAFRDSQEEQKP